MMRALRILAEDPHNTILIITGLTKLKLGDTFSDMKNVTIGTSNGLVYSWGENLSTMEEVAALQARRELIKNGDCKLPTSASSHTLLGMTLNDINSDCSQQREWKSIDFKIDWQAVRDIAVPIISKFTFRTNGTCQTPRLVCLSMCLLMNGFIWIDSIEFLVLVGPILVQIRSGVNVKQINVVLN